MKNTTTEKRNSWLHFILEMFRFSVAMTDFSEKSLFLLFSFVVFGLEYFLQGK